MECNRDEALRSRSMAEEKFLQHDLMGAKRFALKAQCLFPDLEGLPQLMAVLDVHIVAQQKAEGTEANWYRILQTDASADEATIRKQYRKLALILHPDKNKAVGADGAFKLISEAWRVLSDKDKKAAHDARSGSMSDCSVKKTTNGFGNFAHFSSFHMVRQADIRKKTFWTGCPSCKMQFEYMRVHENKRIPCPTCGNVFRATELPDMDAKSKSQPSEQAFKGAWINGSLKHPHRARENLSHMGSSFSVHWGNHKFNASKYKVGANATAEMVQQIYDTVRRERIKAQREAREKAAMARIEAEKEAQRRERMERKQRRKEREARLSEGLVHLDSNVENVPVRESGVPKNSDSEGVDVVSLKSTEGVEYGVTDSSSVNSNTDPKTEFGPSVRGIVQITEPSRCRARSNFDSSNSCDSSDALAFSTKRLKVDV